MTHLNKELQDLKDSILEMWNLVQLQLEKGETALTNFDKDLAREIIANEKRVNAFEIKIDKDCENIFALFNPVAIDLRFVLSVLKINTNLERIGDMVDGIAHFVIDVEKPFDKELTEKTELLEMFKNAYKIIEDSKNAFETEDTMLARTIFSQDEMLDIVNKKAPVTITEYIKNHPEQIPQCLNVLSMIRKLERVGDQSKNIAEEIIFYIEAKVLKHSGKKNKLLKL